MTNGKAINGKWKGDNVKNEKVTNEKWKGEKWKMTNENEKLKYGKMRNDLLRSCSQLQGLLQGASLWGAWPLGPIAL